MIPSFWLSFALTALFAVTGGYALLRWASLRAGVATHHGDQVAELGHLVMSAAMIAMVWAYGGPTGDVAQIVLFGLLGLYFLARRLGDRRAARPGCPAAEQHALMSVAMVWMVAGMPLLMGGGTGSAGGGGHHHGGAAETTEAVPAPSAPTPGWAFWLTVLFVVALAASGLFWTRRALTASRDDEPGDGERQSLVLVGAPGDTSVATRPRALRLLGPRADAVCHLGMSLGMAVMFLTML